MRRQQLAVRRDRGAVVNDTIQYTVAETGSARITVSTIDLHGALQVP